MSPRPPAEPATSATGAATATEGGSSGLVSRARGLVADRGGVPLAMVGSLAYAVCQWGTLVVLARLGTPVLVGQFTLGLALTAPVVMFCNMRLGWLQSTDQASFFQFDDYRRHRRAALAVVLGVVAVIALLRDDPADRLIVFLVGVAKMVESLNDLHYGNFQRHRRLDLLARSQVLRGLLAVAAFTVVFVLSASLGLAVVAVGAAWLVVLAFHDRRLSRALEPGRALRPAAGRWDRVRRLTWSALPLGVTGLLVSLSTSIPRVVVERYLGHAALGVFAAMAYLIVAGRMVAIPFAQALAPRLGEAGAAGDVSRFRRLVARSLAIAGGLGAIGVILALVAGGPLLRLLYGPAYAGEQWAFTVLMTVAGLGYASSFMLVAATAARRLRGQVVVVLASVLATTGAAFAFVPSYGVLGGALSMLAGGLVETVGAGLLLLSAARSIRVGLAPDPEAIAL